MNFLFDEELPERDVLTVKPTGNLKAAGMGVMRGFAETGAAAVRGLQALQTPLNPKGAEKTSRFYEEHVKPAREFWTPDPASLTTAGEIIGGVSGLGSALLFGPYAPYVLVGQTGINTAFDLHDQGVDPYTAAGAGAFDAATMAALVRIPAFGKSIAQTLGLVTVNPFAGAASRKGIQELLEHYGYDKQAEVYDPFDPTAISIDAALGVFFGGYGHAMRARARKAGKAAFEGEKATAVEKLDKLLDSTEYHEYLKSLPIEAEDAIGIIRQHQKLIKDMPFDFEKPRSVRVHLDAMNKALEDLAQDKPVDVSKESGEVQRPVYSDSYSLDEMNRNLKKNFDLSDEQLESVNTLLHANARASGEGIDSYINKRFAGVEKAIDEDTGTGVKYENEEAQEGIRLSETQGSFDFEGESHKAEGEVSDHGRSDSSGRDFPEVTHEKVSFLKSSLTHIKNSKDAAEVARSIGDNAQETLVAVVANKNGKVLAVHRHTIGTISSAAVDVKILAGQILNTKDAASTYIIHNHPSGDPSFSKDDIKISKYIDNSIVGTNVRVEDFIVIARDKFRGMSLDVTGTIDSNVAAKKVPVYERKIVKHSDSKTIFKSPDDVMPYIKENLPEGGVVLLDVKNRPIGILSKLKDYSVLRGEAQADILKEVDRRNAASMIVFEPGRDLNVQELANLHKFGKSVMLGVLDIIDQSGTTIKRYWPDVDDIYFKQSYKNRTKGAVHFLEDGRAVIRAFDGADLTTVVHELGHVFRRHVPASDLKILESEYKIKDGNWTVDAEEQFARGFERYLAEGDAPTPKLQKVFNTFKRWILDVYRNLIGADIWNVRLTPEVRQVMDRLFIESEVPLKKVDTPEAVKAKESVRAEIEDLDKEIIREAEQSGIPVEHTVVEDWGTRKTIVPGEKTKKKMIERAQRRKEGKEAVDALDKEHLRYIMERIESSDEGTIKTYNAEGGEVTGRLGSPYPDWYKNKGYTRKNVLRAIKKALEGKTLGKKQLKDLKALLEDSRDEYGQMYDIDDPIAKHIEGIIDEYGDIPTFEGYDAKGEVIEGSVKERLDAAKAELKKTKNMEDAYMEVSKCVR